MTDNNDFILRPIEPTDCSKNFSLGNPDHLPLKTFLKKKALEYHSTEIAKTYVLVNPQCPSNRIWGYITVMNSQIALDKELRPNECQNYLVFPAIKIARLAIHKDKQKLGYGRIMLDWCINHVRSAIMPHVGCRFLAVDAKRDSIPFYEKNGFTILDTEANLKDPHPLMYIDLHTLN